MYFGVGMLDSCTYYAILTVMRQAFKFEFFRSKRNKNLDRTINVSAHIWNHSVSCHRRYYRMFGKTLPANLLQKHLARHRNGRFPHWQNVGSQSVQAVVDRLYRGWQAWFRHETKRPPTFRSRKKYKSFTLKQAGWKLLGNGKIKIQGHTYRFNQSREILGIVKTVTISRDTTGRYYLSFSCDQVPQPEAFVKIGETAGADFGLKTFLTLSTGEKIDSPQVLKHSLRELRSANRKLSRKQKGSNSRKKARLELSRLHRDIANLRSDWHWKTAYSLTEDFDALFFEDLNLRGMQKLWGRKVSDIGFGDFLNKEEWLCVKYGRGFVKIPRFEPTTKLMSCCGHIQSVALSEREVVCKNCGAIHDRDINAARNIKELGRRLWLGADSKPSSEAVCV